MAKKPKKIRWFYCRNKDGVYLAYTNDILVSKIADIVWNIEVSEDETNKWSYYIDSPQGYIVPERYGGKTLEQAQAKAMDDMMNRIKKISDELKGWKHG